jgi:hypothetical protein
MTHCRLIENVDWDIFDLLCDGFPDEVMSRTNDA